MCHKLGYSNKQSRQHFWEIDRKVEILSKRLGKTKLIITADHGQIIGKRIIEMAKHKQLYDCLTLPLSGEPRVAYCFVRPSREKEFKKYVKTHLSQYCTMHKSEDLIKRNFFGLHKPNPKLFDRVGDYVLIMKEGCVIKDFVLGEKRHIDKGYHGGISKEEMYVPLIII